ncbi:MAG: guanylyltransferase [Clostridia bacterium]|nr:guanylyltransferase [Clostridia bacterium]
MNFDELDRQMRLYEQSIDQRILPDMYLVARLDGRSFSRLTKEICDFEAPFDARFRDMMVNTVKQLMDCGFRVVYGFTESDEISLLFHREENAFGRKVRKYNSILAGEASAAFSLQLGQAAAMDCRLVPLPNLERVKDYFLWRQEDAARNALNSHCYWLLRKEGLDARTATAELEGKSTAYKNELLFSRGINLDKLPLWQKRGVGVYWADVERKGYNPVARQEVTAVRRGLKVEYDLPRGVQYAQLVTALLA